MQWLNKIVDEVEKHRPEGAVLIESGGSPSGTYHIGHLRELVISDAILLELRRRGREARHVYFSDDLDALRKIPVNIPSEFEKYIGYPLSDIPSPKGEGTYGQHFLQGLKDACSALGIEVEFINSHEKYRSGFFIPAIERALYKIPEARKALETVAGRKLENSWSPIQVMEDGRLKNRKFIRLDRENKQVIYENTDGQEVPVDYSNGNVKLDWRLDWPGRWWLMKVDVEPFGRDHASAGGSFATGIEIMKEVYESKPPIPVPYDFINMVGDTKKMSASKGTGLDALEGATIMPPEVIRYFILRAAPSKRLYFDPQQGLVKLIDEFAALQAKTDHSPEEEQLLYVSTHGKNEPIVSSIPFSHLVASYQAALKGVDKTLEVIKRTEYNQAANQQENIIKAELKFIDEWLKVRAPEDVKFELVQSLPSDLSEEERKYLMSLGEKVASAPENADGEYFHKLIYGVKDEQGLEPKFVFATLYKVLIGKSSGPRAGWFLSILPRDWLIKRLKLEG